MRISVVTLLLAAATAHAAEPATADTLAVVPLDGLGVDTAMLDKLDRAVRDEVKALGITALADDVKLKRDCSGDVKCLLTMGTEVHANRVLAGSVGLAGDEVHVTLRLIDVGLQMEVKSLDDSAPADQAERRLRATAMKLLAPDKYVTSGSIAVSTELAGAEIFVDGVKRGTTPMFSPVDGLAPGRREVEVRYPGKKSWRGFIDVSFDQPERVDVAEKDGALIEVPHAAAVSTSTTPSTTTTPPPRQTPVLLYVGAAVGGAGVAALLGSAIAFGAAAQAFDDFNVAPSSAARNRNVDASTWYGILLTTGIIGVVGGGAMVTWSVLE